jgi:hypothetical protein
MRQVNEKEKKQAAKDNLNRIETSFLQKAHTISLQAPVTVAVAAHFPDYQYFYYSQYITAVFRPPKSLV